MIAPSDTERELATRPKRRATPTLIASGLTITGDLLGDDEILLDGALTGNVVCGRLEIGPNGGALGQISADEVVIAGTFSGRIEARRVTLKSTAQVEADIVVRETIAMEPGCEFEGRCKRPGKAALRLVNR